MTRVLGSSSSRDERSEIETDGGIVVHVKKSSLERQFNKGTTSASQVGHET